MPKFQEELPRGYTKGYKQELLDQTPIAVPLGMKTPEPLADMIKRIVGQTIYDRDTGEEFESFDEADDFDCDDDFDPTSPWEEVFEPQTGESLGFLEQNRTRPKSADKWYAERNVNDREVERDNNFNSSNNSNDINQAVEPTKKAVE